MLIGRLFLTENIHWRTIEVDNFLRASLFNKFNSINK